MCECHGDEVTATGVLDGDGDTELDRDITHHLGRRDATHAGELDGDAVGNAGAMSGQQCGERHHRLIEHHGAAPDATQGDAVVQRRTGLLEEDTGAVATESANENSGCAEQEAAIGVCIDRHIRPHGLANGDDARRVDQRIVADLHLQARISLTDSLEGLRRSLLRGCPLNGTIERGRPRVVATEELPERNARESCGEVPAGHVDAGLGVGMPGQDTVHGSGDGLRRPRVAADHAGPEQIERSALTARVRSVVRDAGRTGLTDADSAVVGDETHDERVHASGDPVAGHAVDAFGVRQMDQPRGDPFDRSNSHRSRPYPRRLRAQEQPSLVCLDAELRSRPPVTETSSFTLTLDEVEVLSYRALTAAGASSAQATPTARSIRDAEADGIRTVGLAYLPTYCEHVGCGKVVGDAVPVVTTPRPATVLVDARHGFAHAAFEVGRAPLVEAARACGIGILSISHSYSAGVLGWFVERLADDGLVSVMFANSSSAMAPAGGAAPFFGTNPIAWAAPRENRAPVVADLSSSTVAWVKVKAAADAGEDIPLGWALDAAGHPTTDAAAGLAGSMAPAAGHKGSALALLVDILGGGVTGSNFSFEASGFSGPEGGPPDVGQVILAIDPAATMGDGFVDRLETELAAMTAQPGVRLPGGRRLANREHADANGVLVPAVLMAALERWTATSQPSTARKSPDQRAQPE